MGAFDTYLERKLRELIRAFFVVANKIGVGITVPEYFVDIRSAEAYTTQIHVNDSSTDNGLYIGGFTDTGEGGASFSAGSTYDGTNWVAKGTKSIRLGLNPTYDFWAVYSDTGLTPSNSFTPTEKIYATIGGKVALQGGSGAAVEPSVGFEVQGTDALLLPKGTTAQRPAGVDGYIRFNTDTTRVEAFYGGIWNNL